MSFMSNKTTYQALRNTDTQSYRNGEDIRIVSQYTKHCLLCGTEFTAVVAAVNCGRCQITRTSLQRVQDALEARRHKKQPNRTCKLSRGVYVVDKSGCMQRVKTSVARGDGTLARPSPSPKRDGTGRYRNPK